LTGETHGAAVRPEAVELLERADELRTLAELYAGVAGTRRGRFVLVAGEAGIGKTSLVQAFCSGLRGARVLAGACEALNTARPLGPFVDIAAETGGEPARLIEDGAGPSAVLPALLDELRRRAPSVVVLEDLHWADEATLDLVRLLARRIGSVPALVVLTYRDDELDRSHPLRVALGELSHAPLTRLSLAALSLDGVAALAEPYGVDVGELHERTAGNPFFVTEALAAGGERVPDSVRDAVLARSARLAPGARALLDALAIVPPRAELWLLEALAGDDLAYLEECLASGMLRGDRDAVAFRHEIARLAVEEGLPPDRRASLHQRALRALDTAARPVDAARLAHHADGAGDVAGVLRFAPAAAERAASVGAHREAAAQYARALRYADGLTSEERAEVHERCSYEHYLTGATTAAVDAHRWLSRLAWFAGDNTLAAEEAHRAIELLEALPPGAELAMAYSNLAQLRMLAEDLLGARDWGGRAIELAERLGEREIVVHALNNVGTAELQAGRPEGAEKLARSLALALDAGLEEHVARAYTNLGALAVAARDYRSGDLQLGAGIDYCNERDLDAWVLYMMGWRARSELDQGRWDEAAASAAAVLDHPGAAVPSRITPLVVLGRLRARRGDPDPWAPLDEALALARGTGEVQRLAPVAAARAEARWLAGEPELAAAETDAALALALALEDARAWVVGELCSWRRRAGIVDPIPPLAGAEPFRLELAGELEAASGAWSELGCPYEAALVLVDSTDEARLRWSLSELQQLGALPAAGRVARVLRERGVRNVQRGPRATTRGNPAGLTAREVQVLELLAEGLSNARIAERLVLSTRTVDHHVSAILRKLGVVTRTEAALQAGRLGIGKR
jgi:DNA-binding CsgD family transcriptional regulator/tetratricopeptide (TPR) repeat protein